jgi:hypothetical protein
MPVSMGVIRNEHGVFHARRKVPKHLQAAVAEVLGGKKTAQTWLMKSLRTKDRQEAKRNAPPVLMEFDAVLAQAEDRLKERPLRASLSEAEIARMGAYHYATILRLHEGYVKDAPVLEREAREMDAAWAKDTGDDGRAHQN